MAEHDPFPSEGVDREALERLRAMVQWTPHGRALGLELTRVEPGRVWGRAPYRADLVGDPGTGVIAGGVVTSFLDQLCGMAAVAAMRSPGPLATIDIRIDYLRAAQPGRDVLAEARCTKIGRNIAFVRAVAYEDTPDDPIANATSTFMVNIEAQRKAGANLRED